MKAVAEKQMEKHVETSISSFLKHHYRHFNSATVIDAAEAYATISQAAARCWSRWPAR